MLGLASVASVTLDVDDEVELRVALRTPALREEDTKSDCQGKDQAKREISRAAKCEWATRRPPDVISSACQVQ